MKTVSTASLLALFLTACSSGNSEGETSELQGMVYEVDGQSVDLTGIEIRLVESGRSAMTELDGSFSISGLRTGIYTLDFTNTRFGSLEGDDDEVTDNRPKIEVTGDGAVIEVVAPRTDAVCPIGAGDALNAAFVWAMMRKDDFVDAVRWGGAAGTASACLPGLDFASQDQTRELYPAVEVRTVG